MLKKLKKYRFIRQWKFLSLKLSVRDNVNNLMGARPALLINRDNSIEAVSVLTTYEGKAYIFKYPHQRKDWGREVNKKYIIWDSLAGNLYVWLAVKAVKRFPKYISII